MSYTPIAYTTQAAVTRILRVANAKIKVGDEEDGGQITYADLDAYILDASRVIDMTMIKAINSNAIPITTYSNYPEIGLAAPRIAAYLIYKDMYSAFRIENMPTTPKGWIEDAKDYLKTFFDNLDNGCYPALSASTSGPSWETAQYLFQTQIGVQEVHDLVDNVTGQAPTDGDNIGPYSED